MAEAAIKVWCRACNKKLGFPPSAVGRKAKCPACGLVFVVEAQAERAASKAAKLLGIKDDLLRVECPSCSKVSKYKPAAAGKKARCSACDEVYYVPQLPADSGGGDEAANQGTVADAPAQTDTAPALSEDTATNSYASSPVLVEKEPVTSEEDGLYDVLADAERSAEYAESQEEVVARMQAAAMPKSLPAVSAAGDFQSAVSTGAQRAAESKPSILQGISGAMGPLGKGISLSFAGALFGAFLWYGAAKAATIEIDYLALVIGAFAGAGMQLGTRSESGIAGALAAVIAFMGIIAGKLLVIAWIFLPAVQVQYERSVVMTELADQIVQERKIDERNFKEVRNVYLEARRQVKQMPDSEVHRRYLVWEKANPSSAPQQKPSDVVGDLVQVPPGVIAAALLFFLGIGGIFYSLLAMGIAFKIGGSGINWPGR